MSDFEKTLYEELEKEAPAAGFPSIQFGKLTMQYFRKWFTGSKKTNDSEMHTEVYDGKPLQEKERLNLDFTVDIQEFNPSLGFQYQRSVDRMKSRGKFRTDWTEIVEPSLVAVFGKTWWKEVAKSPYVAVEDVSSVANEKYNTIKFVAKYKNKAECEKARVARFGSNGSTSEAGIPAAVIGQAKGLISGEDEKDAVELLKDAFSEYDANELYRLASA